MFDFDVVTGPAPGATTEPPTPAVPEPAERRGSSGAHPGDGPVPVPGEAGRSAG